MLTLLQRPSQCRVSECNDVEFAISYAVLSGLSLFGIFVYSILAMFFIELPFPCHQYTSKLEKAYRRRHRGLQHFQEAVLGGLSFSLSNQLFTCYFSGPRSRHNRRPSNRTTPSNQEDQKKEQDKDDVYFDANSNNTTK